VPRDWEHSITGVESEVLIQEWLIGDAAASLTTFKISNVTRARPRLTGVVLQSAACEEKTRSITRRELIGKWARSRCPFGVWQLRGALFVESIRPLPSVRSFSARGSFCGRKLPQRLTSMEPAGDDETPGSQKKPAGPPGNGHLVEIAAHCIRRKRLHRRRLCP
jgi:hypothetical protein